MSTTKSELPRSLAVVMACHNRKATTVECLRRLRNQSMPSCISIHVYLVDDASTDGTVEAVRNAYDMPITVIHGSGSLFWCGAMREGYRAATRDRHDAYVWLNDDTILVNDALRRLVDAVDRVSLSEAGPWPAAIVVGSTCDPIDGTTTYGVMTNHRILDPPEVLQQTVHHFNGNCTLITHAAYDCIGPMGEAYSHYMGDNDYSQRALNARVPIYAMPGYVGSCARGETPAWKDPAVPLAVRWRHMHSPKGCPPREYAALRKLMDGSWWPISLAKLYLRCIFPRLTTEVIRRGANEP
jgi:GT2 family glycosyltransferase